MTTIEFNVALTMESSNRKTGRIPVSTSSKVGCPPTCAFIDKGCYAKGGPQNIHWMLVTSGARGTNWDLFCEKIAKLPENQLWRHNASGDLPHKDGSIDRDKLYQLADANVGRRGFTYTHHVLSESNVAAIKESNVKGFTVNASTESVEVADKVMSDHGIPAVAVVKSTESRRFFKTNSGRKVITCPAALFPGKVDCARCGLCAIADREFILAFPAHGNGKKSVDRMLD